MAHLNIYESVEEVIENLANYFVEKGNLSIETHGRFSVALSGGASPEKLYQLLASPPFRKSIEWDKVFFFFGDERYVPLTDKSSNYKMVKEVLFTPLEIPASHVFPVNTSLEPDEASRQYMDTIRVHFGVEEPHFDLVLLGLGDNSHTASLFPYTDILHEQSATVLPVFLADQQVYRISFTAPLINNAFHSAFLVYGAEKSRAVWNILEEEKDTDHFPAQLIRPVYNEPEWFLDRSAAAAISLPE